MERIQKIMAQAGIASRRKCEELIKKGLVRVNGKIVKLGDKADSKKDKITVNDKLIKKEKKVYVILNKPKNVICSVGDKFGRKTVIELVKCKEKIFTEDMTMKAISKLESKRLEKEYTKHPMKIGHSWGMTFPKDMAEVFNLNSTKTKLSLHPKLAENKIEIMLKE